MLQTAQLKSNVSLGFGKHTQCDAGQTENQTMMFMCLCKSHQIKNCTFGVCLHGTISGQLTLHFKFFFSKVVWNLQDKYKFIKFIMNFEHRIWVRNYLFLKNYVTPESVSHIFLYY